MAAEASRRIVAGDGPRMKLMCSHGGRLQPRRPGGAIRYVGGETRVLTVPRDATFRELAVRLAEMAAAGGGAEVVHAVRHRLADEALEDVLVSVTCDEELAHMRDEYDRLRATRPAARFRVFVDTAAPAPAGSGAGSPAAAAAAAAAVELPPLAPKMRRVQSEQAQLHRRPAVPAPVRRVQSAHELAGAVHTQPRFHHHRYQQCCYSGHRRGMCAPAPAPAPARPMYAAPYMSKKVMAAPSTTPAAKATGPKVMNRDAMEETRAIWEARSLCFRA